MEDIRQNIELNYNTNAETTAKEVEVLANSVDNVTDSQDKNTASTKKNEQSMSSFKTQLRQANQELLKMSQTYGETSQEAVKAAKKVAELKDQMTFAKDLVDKFNPDQKMKALTAATSLAGTAMTGVVSGMALFGDQSEDTAKTLLKVQSAMAFGQALSGLSELGDQFQVLKTTAIDAFKGIKSAIGSTGIGLLVIALGALYTYWDDIKEAVSGVSAEQKKLNELSQENVNAENEKLKALGSQDNILKLQGKSEREILAIKVKQTDEAIQATEINQKNQIQTNKLAVDGAKRNYEMLKSYIDFVSTPLRFLYKTGAESINGIIDLLNKIPGVKIKGRLDEALGDKASDYLTKLGFDPDKTKSDGDKVVKESQDALNKLKNDRAGYLLSIREINKKEAEDRKKAEEDETKRQKEELEKRQKANEEYWNKYLELATNKSKEKIDNQKAFDALDAENTAFVNEKSLTDLKEKNDKELEIEKAKVEQKKAIQDQLVSSGEQLIKNIQNLAGKNKAIQKAAIIADGGVAIGKAIANTNEAVTKDLTKGAPFSAPLVALDIAVGATSIASIIKGTNQALQAVGGGSVSSGSGATTTGGGTSASPQMSFQTSKENQIATSLGSKMNEQPPIKAYVTTGDVANGLLLHNKAISENSIGG